MVSNSKVLELAAQLIDSGVNVSDYYFEEELTDAGIDLVDGYHIQLHNREFILVQQTKEDTFIFSQPLSKSQLFTKILNNKNLLK